EKSSKADSRPAISERYKDKDDYLTQVSAAVEELVISGYVLARDIDLCCDIAVRRYDAVFQREPQCEGQSDSLRRGTGESDVNAGNAD
ncbi:MAG: hypothetical protein VYA59_12345, partial [Pseudomonadota bacterium]|nr:hypothetical protein [Pseudomonadota bacterium]